ncbi:hypothetical protein Gohar_021455, partial [Gossypium harknessii]|nr:hypothetical protein [Gossypium harknessii]
MEEIGSLVGKVARLDIKTNIDTRERVEFESLLVVCFSCGCYGHLKELCPSIVPDLNSDGGKVKASVLIVKGSALVDVEKPFRPW